MAKKAQKTKGVMVAAADGKEYPFFSAIGWNVGADSVLYVAGPNTVKREDGQLINELLATFREWKHVTWL